MDIVGIVGDYVWGDLYDDNEKINFMKHRYGHADYYRGDEESFVTLNAWLDGKSHPVILDRYNI